MPWLHPSTPRTASTAGRQPQTTAQWQSSIPESLYSPQTGGNSDNVTDMAKWYTEHDPYVEVWKTKDGNYLCYFSPRIKRLTTLPKKLDSLARWATSLRCWCLRVVLRHQPQTPMSLASMSWATYGSGSTLLSMSKAVRHGDHVQYMELLSQAVQLLTQNNETEWKYT